MAVPPLISHPDTILKVASMVNVPLHTQSSHSTVGMAQASLDDEDIFDDEFQMHHTPIRWVV